MGEAGDLEAGGKAAERRSYIDWCVPLVFIILLCVLPVGGLLLAMYLQGSPSVSVHLMGYDGIDPGGAAPVVSPAFNITLRLNDTCVDRAEVAVMYSGVALGWARADPRDCAKRRWAKDVEVVARGGGVGLSQRLRQRMAADWRSGTMELDIDVTTYKEDSPFTDTEFPQYMIVHKVRINETTDASQTVWLA
uniref:Uncharacterized protein n=1 Tax=Avena sativa TaxID=4498 RepID=A0ACD5W390_AVESA